MTFSIYTELWFQNILQQTMKQLKNDCKDLKTEWNTNEVLGIGK